MFTSISLQVAGPSFLLTLLYLLFQSTQCAHFTTKAVEWAPASQPVIYRGYRVLNSSEFLMVVIGTKARSLWRLQQETWMQHFPHTIITEDHVPKCTLCGASNGTMPHLNTFFQGDRWQNMSINWYCAQQRPLQALQAVMRTLHDRPPWLVVIDDDTFLHPWNFLRTISRLMADGLISDTSETMIGHHFIGGAGFVFAPGAVSKLGSQIEVADLAWDSESGNWVEDSSSNGHSYLEACLHRLMGGSWCYQHSDHIWGRCAKSAAIRMVHERGMVQFCPVGTTLWKDAYVANPVRSVSMADNGTQDWLRNDMVSCHYMDRLSMHSIHDHVKDLWSLEAQGQQQYFPEPPMSPTKAAVPALMQPSMQELRLQLSELQSKFAQHREAHARQQHATLLSSRLRRHFRNRTTMPQRDAGLTDPQS